MIEPDVVTVLRGPAQTLNPPRISAAFHHIPTIERIAPTLPGLAEEIRRHSGDDLRFKLFTQPEKIGVRPDISAVIVHEDRHIPNDPDFALGAIAAQRVPLLVKCKLKSAANLQINR